MLFLLLLLYANEKQSSWNLFKSWYFRICGFALADSFKLYIDKYSTYFRNEKKNPQISKAIISSLWKSSFYIPLQSLKAKLSFAANSIKINTYIK